MTEQHLQELTCQSCEGDGRVLKNAGLNSTGPIAIVTCPSCDGAGKVPSDPVEFDYGGCKLTDEGSVEEIAALVGSEARYRGKPGIVESIRLVEGVVPWPGQGWPRPVYRVRWRPTDV